MYDYCILDVESTGLDSEIDEIISVSCLKIRNGNHVDTFNLLCYTDIKISPLIKKLTGITNMDLTDKEYSIVIMEELYDFIGKDVVLIHNATFDIEVLIGDFERNGYSYQSVPKFKFIDTLSLTKNHFSREEVLSYSLENMIFVMGLNYKPHNSFDDCMIVFELVKLLRDSAKPELPRPLLQF